MKSEIELKHIEKHSYIPKGQQIIASEMPTPVTHTDCQGINHGTVTEFLWSIWKDYLIWFVDKEKKIVMDDLLVRERTDMEMFIRVKDRSGNRFRLLRHERNGIYECSNSIQIVTSVKNIEFKL